MVAVSCCIATFQQQLPFNAKLWSSTEVFQYKVLSSSSPLNTKIWQLCLSNLFVKQDAHKSCLSSTDLNFHTLSLSHKIVSTVPLIFLLMANVANINLFLILFMLILGEAVYVEAWWLCLLYIIDLCTVYVKYCCYNWMFHTKTVSYWPNKTQQIVVPAECFILQLCTNERKSICSLNN